MAHCLLSHNFNRRLARVIQHGLTCIVSKDLSFEKCAVIWFWKLTLWSHECRSCTNWVGWYRRTRNHYVIIVNISKWLEICCGVSGNGTAGVERATGAIVRPWGRLNSIELCWFYIWVLRTRMYTGLLIDICRLGSMGFTGSCLRGWWQGIDRLNLQGLDLRR